MAYKKQFSFLLLTISASLLLMTGRSGSSHAGVKVAKAMFKGCFKDDIRDPSFFIIPLNFRPEKNIVSTCIKQCTALSSMVDINYAGIQESNFCLCAQDNRKKEVEESSCNQKCISPELTCGSKKDPAITSVYNVYSAYGGVKIKEFKRTDNTQQNATFEIKPNQGGYTYIIDFGDGTPEVIVDDGEIPSHFYPLPGTYQVSIIANPGSEISSQSVTTSTTITVDQPITKKSLQVTGCPKATSINTPFTYNVSVDSGTNTLLAIAVGKRIPPKELAGLKDTGKKIKDDKELRNLFNDGLKKLDADAEIMFQYVDVASFAVGPAVPQSEVEQTESLKDKHFIMVDSVVPESGVITAFQMYGAQKGSIEIWVLKPKALKNSTHCFATEECDNDLIFYPYCNDAEVSSDSYEIRSKIDKIEKVKKGYQLVTLDKDYVSVESGDVLAYKAGDGTLAYRDVYPDENADIVYPEKSEKSSRRKRQTAGGKRHFLQAIVETPVDLQFDQTFANSGNYSILVAFMSLSNKTQKTYVYNEVTVVEPLEEFQISFNDKIQEVKKDVAFGGSFQKGSFAKIKWYFGDEETAVTYHDGDLKNGASITTSHSYDKVGVYNVRAEATNAVNGLNSSNSLTVTVISPLDKKDWEVTCDADVLVPDGKLNCSVKFVGSGNNSNGIIIEANWGDGNVENFTRDDFASNTQFPFEHGFNASGNYTVFIRVINPVSEIKIERKVSTLNRIEPIKATVVYSDDEESKEFKRGIGHNHNVFPKNTFVNVTFDRNKGDIENYVIMWENETVIKNTTEPPTFKMEMIEEGTYTLKLYATNRLQLDNPPILVTWRVSSGLLIDVDDLDEVTDFNEAHVFKVFNKSTSAFCLLVDYGDGNKEKYGDKDYCDQNFTDVGYNDRKIGYETDFSHVYVNRGYYDFVATVFTDVEKITRKLPITVNKSSFKRHKTIIRINSTDPLNPIDVMKSTGYRIETQVYLEDAMEVINVTMKWSVTPADPVTGEEIDPTINLVNETFGASWNKSFLFIKPRILNYGFYKATYQFLLTSNEMDPLYPVNTTSSSFYNITKTPLAAVIVEEDLYRIMRGYGQMILLEPDKYSSDGDQNADEDKNFTIKWFCSRIDRGEKIDSYNISDEDMQEILPPTGDHKHLPDNGGCFGLGPGRINVGSKTWNLDAKSLYKPDQTYRIEIEIAKDDRSSNASLLILLGAEPAPVLQIKCLNDALCVMTTDGTLINPSIRFAAYGQCVADCPTSNFTFMWKITGTNDEDSLETTELDLAPYIIGQGENMMAVSVDFFKTYSQFKVLSVSMEIIEEKEVAGQVTNRLIINLPPENGTCELTEEKTYSLIEEFVVVCRDWVDPDEHLIGKYRIFIRDEKGYNNTLVTSSDYRFRILLRPGRLELWSEVSDIHGASTTDFIKTVEVLPPSQAEYIDFVKNKFPRLKLSGNQFQLMQALQAMGMIEHQDPPFEGYADPEDGTEAAKQLEIDKSENLNTYMGFLKECNINTIDDIDFVSNTAGTLIGKGHFLDRKGKDLALDMAVSLTDMLISPNFDTIKFVTPLQSKSFLTNTMSIVGAVAAGVSKTILQDKILPSDMEHVDELNYDTAINDDPDFAIPATKRGMKIRSLKNNAIQKSIAQFQQIDGLVQNINGLVLSNLVPKEPPLDLITISGVQMSIVRTKPEAAAGLDLPQSDANFNLPDYCILTNQGPNCTDTAPFSISVVTWNGPINPASKNIDALTPSTKIVQIDTFTGNLNTNTELPIKNSTEEIDIVIPRNPTELPNVTEITPKLKWFEFMVYHQVEIPRYDSAVNLEFSIDSPAAYAIYLRYQKKPTIDQYDKVWRVLPSDMTNGTFGKFIPSQEINNQTGYFYFGVAELKNASEGNTTNGNITKEMVNKNFSTSYNMRIFSSSCLYYSDFSKLWVSDGCRVFVSGQISTHCKCTHLTSFGSGFFVAPNPIDFSYVFAHASFADNLTIYVTIIVTFALFVIFLIWARCKDKKDIEKIGALPLPDNNPNDKYMYEILVFTGNSKGASTDSKVNFILSGDKDETEIRTFGHPPRKIFRRDGVDVFVMSVPRPLGQLQFVRIWHDNSGKGNFASWYLNYVIFRDVQTGEKFEFVCSQWLALEKDDGQIDRVLPVADKAQLTEFSHLFTTTSRKKLTDGHLWFSVFLRPPRSRFTRCQRVGACMSLLYLSMLVNAMWYGTVPDTTDSGFKFGPVQMSPEQICVGFMSNIIVFPPSFFIIFLFRKARPRKLRPSRIDQALETQRKNKGGETSRNAPTNVPNEEGKPLATLKYNRTKRCTLPWWCVIVAWILCFVCMATSIFFLWAYGITFGNEKTKKWITSLIISFFSSILITQPIKVFLVAMIFSSICKKVETDEDDADEDELDPHLDFDEQWLNNDPTKPRKVAYKQMQDPEAVERARDFRRKEVKTSSILKEIFAYLIFLYILGAISNAFNDPNAFWMVRNLKKVLLKEGKIDGYMSINNPDDFWKWTNNVLMYNLRVQRDYAGNPAYGFAGFLNDRVNRLMGYPIMRQIRLKPGRCKVPPIAEGVSRCSGTTTEIVREDDNNYNIGWEVIPKNVTIELAEWAVVHNAFRYTSEEDLDGFPFVGNLDMYSGAGYVFELKGSTEQLVANLVKLQQNNWVDHLTRAIMIDFSAYNAQVNLFGVVSLYCEFIPGGGVYPDWAIDAIRLIEYEGGAGMFLATCQVIFILFILYFTVHELREMCKKGRKYFRECGNYAELALLIFAYAAIVTFFVRYEHAERATKKFNVTKGSQYINLHRCQVLSSVLNWLMALIVFVSGIKFIKLLRFNKRLRMLAQTLIRCAIDLKGFFLVFLIVFFAFAQVFYIFYQAYNPDYSTPIQTLESMFSVLLQKFSYDDYLHGGTSHGPLVFFGFSLTTCIILINLFLTIIIQTFEQVKTDLADKPNEFEVADFVVRKFKSLFGFGGKPPEISAPDKDKASPELEMNHPTNRFPQKVDQLLEYINTSYFDGKLDLNSKQALRHGKRKLNYNPYGDDHLEHRPNVYNSN